MDIILETASPEQLGTAVLVVGAFADGPLPPPTRTVDEVSKGKLATLITRGDLEATAGASLLLHDLPGVSAERVLLVSLGTRQEFGDKAFRDALGSAARTLAGGAAKDAAVTLTDLDWPGRSLDWRLEQASRLLADGAYRFDAPGLGRTTPQERGAIIAACFLARFTKAYKWAHLDIAGTASVSGDAKGATGRPVPLVSEFLMRRADAKAS